MINTETSVSTFMSTDADWGRFYQFDDVNSNSGIVMPFRSYYLRDFFSGGWNDLSVGVMHCSCGNSGDYSALNDERQSEDAIDNLPHFGISQSNKSIIDVLGNPYFVGVRGIKGGLTQLDASLSQIMYVQPTLVNNGVEQVGGSGIALPLSSTITSTPFTIWGLRVTFDAIQQKLYINFASETNIATQADGDDVTLLDTFLKAISNSPSDALATFNCTDVSSFSTFYLFWPYLLNKMKLQCVGLLKMG